jgi:antitoxin PrlF
MKEILSTVTSKGQITIPLEVRDRLGLRQGDKVVFVLADHQVILRRTGSIVAATAGVLKSTQPPLSAEELREAAAQAIAEEAAERGRR